MTQARRDLTVLGIDPGSQCLGWGVVREVSGVASLVDCGTIRPNADEFEQRLGQIFPRSGRCYRPSEARRSGG